MILNYFAQVQNYLFIEENLKIVVKKEKKRKIPCTEVIMNHKATRMVKDGEDWHGLQTTNMKNSGLIFHEVPTVAKLFQVHGKL